MFQQVLTYRELLLCTRAVSYCSKALFSFSKQQIFPLQKLIFLLQTKIFRAPKAAPKDEVLLASLYDAPKPKFLSSKNCSHSCCSCPTPVIGKSSFSRNTKPALITLVLSFLVVRRIDSFYPGDVKICKEGTGSARRRAQKCVLNLWPPHHTKCCHVRQR